MSAGGGPSGLLALEVAPLMSWIRERLRALFRRSQSAPGTEPAPISRRRRVVVRCFKGAAILGVVWLLAAYVILPALWKHYEHHPALENAPKTTLTAQGIP